MFRLARNNSIQTAVRQINTLSKQTITKLKCQPVKTSIAQINLSNHTKRFMSTSGGISDNAMYALAAAVTVGSSAFAYYAINTEYAPEIKDVETSTDGELTEATEALKSSDTETNEVEVSEEQPSVEQTEVSSDIESEVSAEVTESAVTVDSVEQIDEQTIKPLDVVVDTITGIPYVIVGAGTSAHAACRAIRKNDPKAKILVIGEEEALPYMRPPLSKELWFSDEENVSDTLLFKSWDGKERSVFFETEEFYSSPLELQSQEEGGIGVLMGKKVTGVNPEEHLLTLSSGETVNYEKLLIATGGKPRHHAAFDTSNNDITQHTTLFRNVADFKRLDKVLKGCETVAIVGGGFLGSELACALSAKTKASGMKVTQIYAEDGNMAKVLPRYLSDWTTRKVKKEGVDIIGNRSVKNAQYENGKMKIVLDNEQKVEADHVIVCVGIEPNVDLASSAGLEVDAKQGGFLVNSELEGRSDIWVAGDAACFYDVNLGRRRVEHHDHAVVSGRLAGENMTGAKKIYKHQSMFWSDLGPEVGYEAIGIVDSSLPTVGVWSKATAKDTPKAAAEATGEGIRSEVNADETTTESPTQVPTESTSVNDKEEFGKGVVFYMKEKRIVGVLLWNIFSQMPVARRIISEGKDHEDLNATAKLFKIHK